MENKEEKLTKCPCCGKITLKLPVKVKQEELDRYVACMATGEAYTKTYQLFNGTIQVTVTEPKDVIKDKMNMLMSKFTMLEDGPAKDTANTFIVRLLTLLPILSISIHKEGQEKPEIKDINAVTLPLLDDVMEHLKDIDWLNKAYQKLCDPQVVSGVTKTVLDRLVAKHTETCILLQDSGFDPDFFAGIVQD